jgi:hypothetical protein
MVTDPYPWRRQVCFAVAKMYLCQYFYSDTWHKSDSSKKGYVKRNVHGFVGASHNIEVAKSMAVYIMGAIDRLAKEGARSVPANERSPYRTTFRTAASLRVVRRIDDLVREAKSKGIKSESGTNLPALNDLYDATEKAVSEWLKSKVSLRTAKFRATINHSKGLRDGNEAGDRIGLTGQIGGKASTHLLS